MLSSDAARQASLHHAVSFSLDLLNYYRDDRQGSQPRQTFPEGEGPSRHCVSGWLCLQRNAGDQAVL